MDQCHTLVMTEQGCQPSCVSSIPALLLGFDSAELSSEACLRDQPELYNLNFASDGLMHEAEASHSERLLLDTV